MTNEEVDLVFLQYQALFKEPLQTPPLEYGHHHFTAEELARYGQRAIAQGQPIDWDEHLAPLEDDAVS